jgi:hypothetical protein
MADGSLRIPDRSYDDLRDIADRFQSREWRHGRSLANTISPNPWRSVTTLRLADGDGY